MASKLHFTLLLIFFSAFIAESKINLNYKPGIIITNDNDTIYGLIKDRGGIRNSKACFFKKDKDSKSEKLLPNNIKAYSFIGGKQYQSDEIIIGNEYKYVFLEVLLQGKLILYHLWNNKGMNYFIQKDDNELIGLTNEKIHSEKVANEIRTIYSYEYESETQSYKNTLREIFQESRKTQNQIFNVNYNKRALISITKYYIKETCGMNCIEYTKDLDLERSQFGFYSGVSFNRITFQTYREKDSPTNGLNLNSDLFVTYPLGIFFNFPLTLISDNFSFQTELFGSQIKYVQDFKGSFYYNNIAIDYMQVGIALMLKYEMFQHQVISPSLAFGKNSGARVSSRIWIDDLENITLHPVQKGGWFLEAGIDYKLSSKFSLFSNFRIYSVNNLVVSTMDKGVSYNTILSDFAYPLEYKTNVGSVIIGLKF